ncbi:YqcI/YcgG family protein [Nocardia vaccinii]|uniref:YqcI/YcgG family protein n=1 Tax=Nocardia vaccinii TaxID=1822 RepID=UPI001471C0EB|nr:YqcI/YcgG family protein [Nocardia vaccinii]
MLEQSSCVFAVRSNIWVAPSPTTEMLRSSFDEWWIPNFRGFIAASKRERIDGFLLCLPARYGSTLPNLAATTRDLVAAIGRHDSRGSRRNRPETPGWKLTFEGRRLFVITFAPCYPESNSRSCFGENHTFILIQPDEAFERAVTPGDGGLISMRVRHRIRDRYASRGQGYDHSISESPVEAFKFVKPIAAGDPLVRWWDPELYSGTGRV